MLYPLQEAVTHTCTHARSLIHTRKDGDRWELQPFLFSMFVYGCTCEKGLSLVVYPSLDLARARPGSPCMSCPAMQSQQALATYLLHSLDVIHRKLAVSLGFSPGLLLYNGSLQPGVGPALSLASLTQTERDKHVQERQVSQGRRFLVWSTELITEGGMPLP